MHYQGRRGLSPLFLTRPLTGMVLPLLALVVSSFAADGSSLQSTTADSAAVILRFGGDVLLAGYYESAMDDGPAQAFDGFPALADADVAMVNLECPVTVHGAKVSKPFNFRMSPRYLRVLSDAGIDIVSLANNHIYDYGKEGLFDTISYLDSVAIRHVGAGRDGEEAYRPVVCTLRGHTVAFLAYYGGGEAPGAGRNSSGVARRELGRIVNAITSVRRDSGATYVVVNLHWGTEKAEKPDASQRAFARALIDAGADAVIGHHPHVLQGIELYRSGVIVYSLGNFVFGGNSRSTYDTGLMEIRLGTGGPRYSFLPVRIADWRAKLLSGPDSAFVIERVRRLSTGFARSIFNK
jgi:poly-gamma-glutamate capsule biosynthesis protein CapA/YwtB (metallophosphatase superfamily)